MQPKRGWVLIDRIQPHEGTEISITNIRRLKRDSSKLGKVSPAKGQKIEKCKHVVLKIDEKSRQDLVKNLTVEGTPFF